MRLIVDTHVHIYPCYDRKLALDNLRSNLAALDSQAVCMALLAERYDCGFFAEMIRNPKRIIPGPVQAECLDNAILLREAGYPDLYIIAGRQVVTAERIEILSLTSGREIPDGLPVDEVLAMIRSDRGLPVVSWSPGKWLGQRGKVIERLFNTAVPGSLLVGDTFMRPSALPDPSLMRLAVRNGFSLIAGSDPLPLPREERFLGRYAIRLEADFDPDDPAGSIRALLSQPGARPVLAGSRSGIISAVRRLITLRKSKK